MQLISTPTPRLPGVLACLLATFGCWGSSHAQTASVEVGSAYSSADSYRFGQYSGITSQGGYGVGGFLLQSESNADADGRWLVSGRNLGLETASLAASFRRWGEFSWSLNYDQLPHYRFNDGLTPFAGSGSVVQTLPAGWTAADSTAGFTGLATSLVPVNIDKKRERISSELTWRLSPYWEFNGGFRHETKRGKETLGAIFGSSGGNPRGSILARPVDYQTDELSVGVSYARQRSQYSLSYSTMRFSNDNKALRFDNPFDLGRWEAGANFSDGAVGQIALEPDNVSHQFALSAARSFDRGTRLSASLVSSRLEQDDSFLPYSSVFPAPTPLPAADLNGRVDSLLANLRLSTRLTARGTLNLRYRYRERNNRTPQAVYLRIPGDAALQGTLLSDQARVNRIYDLDGEKFSADFKYRFSGRTRLTLGAERQQTDRSMLDVATTREDSGFARLNFAPGATASAWIKLSRARRDASSYDASVPFVTGHNPDYVATLVGNDLFENDPLLRRFHLTDRDRDELSASLHLFPAAPVGISFLALLAADDYPDARVGLQESDKRSYSVDLSYNAAAGINASLYYNYENYRNRQAGYARRGGGNPTPFWPESVRLPGNAWNVSSRDRIHSVGSALQWTPLPERLDLTLEANYSDADSSTRPYSSDQPFLPMPDTSTRITSVELSANYRLGADRELLLGYYFERFRSADWSLDGAGVATLANILLLGNRSPDYAAHYFSVSLRMSF